jgi:hypothetical protein
VRGWNGLSIFGNEACPFPLYTINLLLWFDKLDCPFVFLFGTPVAHSVFLFQVVKR